MVGPSVAMLINDNLAISSLFYSYETRDYIDTFIVILQITLTQFEFGKTHNEETTQKY